MNTRSLKLIRDVLINSGKVTSIEISQDSMYLEFKNVELGNPKSNEEMSLTVRFAEDSFFTVFYNNIQNAKTAQESPVRCICDIVPNR